MTNTHEPIPRKPLRLWPGVAAAGLIAVAWFVAPFVVTDGGAYGIIGAFAGAVAIVFWWLFFSRAPWSERLGAVVLMAVALTVTRLIVHESIRTGHMGMTLPIYGIPLLALALVAWAVGTRRLAAGARQAALAGAILLACGLMALVRTGGITADGRSDFHWRWTLTPEERLLAQAGNDGSARATTPAPTGVPAEPPGAKAVETVPGPVAAPAKKDAPVPAPAAENKATAAPPAAEAAADPARRAEWSGFRGPARDGVIRGVRIETDWSTSPPAEVWRRPIGPGWSSFAVQGDLVYTQEQRGNDEVVSCYRLTTGEPVWAHRDAVRFYESNGGPGPRGTPALGHGRVYSLGATGILNALDADTGAVVWSRNAATDTGATLPGWGFSGSPLVVGDLVIVAASGRLAAYNAATGEPRWSRLTVGGGYSSPHLATIGGVAQIVLLSGGGATGVAPGGGELLWQHTWESGVSIVQPAVTENGDVLVSGGDSMGGIGMRRLAIARGSAGWTAEPRWTSRGLKPYFNDFVVHKGHAFGFDGTILACIDLADGARRWKGGRYGAGQLVVLPDQDVLLVLSEAGELALVSATPDKYTEVARLPAIEGKTWNHPVVAGDLLLVRNGEEMAAFRLALAGR
jgi:outer membrane protein assembly factor BamB